MKFSWILLSPIAAAWTKPMLNIHRPSTSLLSFSSSSVKPTKQDIDCKRSPGFGDHRVSGLATACIGFLAACCAPLPAAAQTPPPQVVNVQVNLSNLKQFVWENKDDLLRLLNKGIVSNVQIKLPSNIIEFTKDALKGDVLLNVNGLPIDLSILSDKGGVDVTLISDQGDLSLTIASQYLPKLPLLDKPYIPLTPDAVAEFRAARLEMAKSGPPTFWEDVSVLDVFRQGWTNAQVIGSTALTIGYVSFAAKTVSDSEIGAAEREARLAEEAAEEKKRAAAERRSKLEAELAAKNDAIQKNNEAIKRRKAAFEAAQLLGPEKIVKIENAYLEDIEYSPTVVPQKPAIVSQLGLYVSPRIEQVKDPKQRRQLAKKVALEEVEQDEAALRKRRAELARQNSVSSLPGITTEEYVEALEYSPTVVPQKPSLLEQTGSLSSPRTFAGSSSVKKRQRKWFKIL